MWRLHHQLPCPRILSEVLRCFQLVSPWCVSFRYFCEWIEKGISEVWSAESWRKGWRKLRQNKSHIHSLWWPLRQQQQQQANFANSCHIQSARVFAVHFIDLNRAFHHCLLLLFWQCSMLPVFYPKLVNLSRLLCWISDILPWAYLTVQFSYVKCWSLFLTTSNINVSQELISKFNNAVRPFHKVLYTKVLCCKTAVLYRKPHFNHSYTFMSISD